MEFWKTEKVKRIEREGERGEKELCKCGPTASRRSSVYKNGKFEVFA